MATALPPDFREFLRLLNASSVDYLLIGGHAVAFHGYPRATADLDVWVAMSPANAERIVDALREFGFDVDALVPALFQKPDAIVRFGLPPMRIEVLTTLSGVTFDECHRERVPAVIDGIPVDVISLRHLRINKQASGRLKDLADLEHLPEPD
jgi:hypothetical protein